MSLSEAGELTVFPKKSETDSSYKCRIQSVENLKPTVSSLFVDYFEWTVRIRQMLIIWTFSSLFFLKMCFITLFVKISEALLQF